MYVPVLVYKIIGFVLCVSAGAWLYRSLFGLRAKDQPRCPKCWYDMSGARGLTCPECGKTVRSARGLLKYRKPKRKAVLAALALSIGVFAWCWPTISLFGWIRSAPTWALLVLYPLLDPPTDAPHRFWHKDDRAIHHELYNRLGGHQGTAAQNRALAWLAWLWMRPSQPSWTQHEGVQLCMWCGPAADGLFEEIAAITRNQSGSWLGEYALYSLSRARPSHPRVYECIEELSRTAPSSAVLFNMLQGLGSNTNQAEDLTPLLIRLLDLPAGDVQSQVASALLRIQPPPCEALPALQCYFERADRPPPAGWPPHCLLAVLEGRAASQADYYSRRLDVGDKWVRSSAAWSVHEDRGPYSPETVANLSRALDQETDVDVLEWLFYAIASHPGECRELVPRLWAVTTKLNDEPRLGLLADRAAEALADLDRAPRKPRGE